jgi:hypothetical protein
MAPAARPGQPWHSRPGSRQSLRFRVGGLAEAGPEPVVCREPHILCCGHHDIGDHAAFQAGHPVGQHLARHPAQHLEAFGQRQRRGRPLITSEPDEPEPRSGQHRADYVQPASLPSRSPGALPGEPHRRPPAPVMLPAPGTFPLRDQAAEAPRRPSIARRLGRRQQPLRRDPVLGLLHPLSHQGGHAVIVMAPRRPSQRGTTGLMPVDHPLHGLVRGPVTCASPR